MTPVLYILMRTDMDSMNPGKGMAQAAHAANAFVADMQSQKTRMFEEWQAQTSQGFGTTIVLSVDQQMYSIVDCAQLFNLVAGIVHDPSYPLRDGDFVHSIPLDTCAYVFADKDDDVTKMVLSGCSLHP